LWTIRPAGMSLTVSLTKLRSGTTSTLIARGSVSAILAWCGFHKRFSTRVSHESLTAGLPSDPPTEGVKIISFILRKFWIWGWLI